MRKYYTFLFNLVSDWAIYSLTVSTKNSIGRSLLEVDQVFHANSRLVFDGLSTYRLSISFTVGETSLTIYNNSLMFYLPLLIDSKNFEINISSKTICL